jgi:tryptophan-rich sensory protein
MTRHHPVANALFSTGVVAAAAVAGSLATDPDSTWYQELDKPGWQPPRAAFPLAWTSLYAGAAITSAAVLDHHEREGNRGEAIKYRCALVANMALNASWSYLFFQRRQLGGAAAGAVALAVSTACLARKAGRAGRGHAVSLLPYAAWTAFASALSADIWHRNG